MRTRHSDQTDQGVPPRRHALTLASTLTVRAGSACAERSRYRLTLSGTTGRPTPRAKLSCRTPNPKPHSGGGLG